MLHPKKNSLAVLFTALTTIVLSSFSTTASAQQECFIGEIRYFAGDFAPRNWAFAQGQLMSIAQNTALFSILGTNYGGDGKTTFALPNLSGRTPVSAGRGPGLSSISLGELFGTEQAQMAGVAQMPAHTHGATTTVTVQAYSAAGATGSPSGAELASPGDSNRIYRVDTPSVDLNANTLSASTTIGDAGGGMPFNNMQPSLVMNPIICLVGIYPSRP